MPLGVPPITSKADISSTSPCNSYCRYQAHWILLNISPTSLINDATSRFKGKSLQVPVIPCLQALFFIWGMEKSFLSSFGSMRSQVLSRVTALKLPKILCCKAIHLCLPIVMSWQVKMMIHKLNGWSTRYMSRWFPRLKEHTSDAEDINFGIDFQASQDQQDHRADKRSKINDVLFFVWEYMFVIFDSSSKKSHHGSMLQNAGPMLY